MEIIVSDLDSTLANTEQRHHLAPVKVDPTSTLVDRALWVPFSMACYDDEVIEGTAVLLRLLGEKYPIFFVSHRAEEAFTLTSAWLQEKAEVPYESLRLHRVGDADDSPTFKRDYIRQLQAEGYDVKLYLDDWPDVVRKVTAETGVPCLCINPIYTAPPPWLAAKAIVLDGGAG